MYDFYVCGLCLRFTMNLKMIQENGVQILFNVYFHNIFISAIEHSNECHVTPQLMNIWFLNYEFSLKYIGIMKHLKQRKREHLFSKENCVDISILWKYEQLLYINRKISIEITNWYVFSAKFSFIIPWKLLLWRRPV